jgi:hypothetical protein
MVILEQVVVVANSTNKTWVSSTDLQDDASVQSHRFESGSSVGTPSSTPSTLDRVKGRKLDDSEVVVFSPTSSDVQNAEDDIYEQSKRLFSNTFL